jgi:hypothetical protein
VVRTHAHLLSACASAEACRPGVSMHVSVMPVFLGFKGGCTRRAGHAYARQRHHQRAPPRRGVLRCCCAVDGQTRRSNATWRSNQTQAHLPRAP